MGLQMDALAWVRVSLSDNMKYMYSVFSIEFLFFFFKKNEIRRYTIKIIFFSPEYSRLYNYILFFLSVQIKATCFTHAKLTFRL